MKVIVDNKIPYIKGIIETLADEVIYLPGKDFTPEVVHDADALIIRTRTRCNSDLLEGSKVKFIGTATIGYDHIDTTYCEKAGMTWSNCPGCNAGAVQQYIHSVLALFQAEKGIYLKNCCLGIIGVGHVGSKILELAEKLGITVLLNDPPRADRGETGFTDLNTIAKECDIISFHTPLDKDSRYCTYHLADKAFFNSLKKRPYIINTSRGEVIETEALLSAIDTGQISGAVIDVWENEPNISNELLEKVFIGTPHIAGYSADGKANATRMVLEAYCRYFDKPVTFQITLPEKPQREYSEDLVTRQLEIYNPRVDYDMLKANIGDFEHLRGNYNLRRE
ncbi:4-phosphoerythronate dehydrogenase PdxB [uncultured Bacteroides sp.]|uniref:4-phosphoerythronate dehydrogenase PdxB n=1 Tax=uncultured Bacteroides sp. TaxID=162156 RepID=UPI002623EEAE|nr:4-phosphoerythronate dehydrogenase PdxB [uncultured Bacteroides sp.]